MPQLTKHLSRISRCCLYQLQCLDLIPRYNKKSVLYFSYSKNTFPYIGCSCTRCFVICQLEGLNSYLLHTISRHSFFFPHENAATTWLAKPAFVAFKRSDANSPKFFFTKSHQVPIFQMKRPSLFSYTGKLLSTDFIKVTRPPKN